MKKKQSAKIDGTVFYNAAKKYGLPTTNAGLNKLVKLVNTEGLTPLQAAKKISQGK
jgi:hypothetical protein|tara:strand:+ start:159 stop:326 length:168 start_codon:yes stop_codon:yes gene_type:complete